MIKIENVRLSAPSIRPATPAEERLSRYSVTVDMPISPAMARWVDQVRIIGLCGYDPQRLLEYKPETLAEWAARHDWRYGGTITGRWSGRALPDYEYIMPKGRIPHLFPGEKIEMTPYPEVDYGGIEARVMAFYETPRNREPRFYPYQMGPTSFREALERNAHFDRLLREHGRLVENRIQALAMNAMLAVYIDTPPRDARISRLVHSNDPRQRKRGRRLLEKSRQPVLWGDLAKMPGPYEDLKKWCNTNIGEPYNPENYRKD